MKYSWRLHFELGWFPGETFELLGVTIGSFLPDMFVLLGLKFGKLIITVHWDREMLALGDK
jgi:hypothetical protein